MIDRHKLLADLKPILKEVEADLRARCDEAPQIDTDLNKEYEQARTADRTGVTYEVWRADLITQVAVAWVLSCVFVRFLEDNALIAPPRISGPLHGAGPDAGLMRARDERETYFKTHAKQTDREYLLAVLDDLAKLSGTKDVFGVHNVALAYRNWLSGDAAQKLIEFFQKIDADGNGDIIHDFTDPTWDTRFLGDLYQDLSEAARKKYALLQTPIFVEEFILERTLDPAINEFGLKDFKMIDPACGSGHFLLGSFARILKHWRAKEPAPNERELVNRTLASVHGVDVNPFAVAIARFRLLLAAMRECHLTHLKDAPAFAFNLVCGDSLLHGSPGTEQLVLHGLHEMSHVYQSEDLPELQRILQPGRYHAVVANPPYITVKDKALNQAYRERYPEVCHRQYSLSVPFLQRLFILACDGGFTGQITANSFMKREFGKKLIEGYLPKIDLTHVLDTAGAYIPGHGTPTVILFGRNRKPVAPTIRAVMGIKGEPAAPDNPAQGLVWTAITQQIDHANSKSIYVSVNDAPRGQLGKHPWSIGGGGAAELKEVIEKLASKLGPLTKSIGRIAHTGDDDAYIARPNALQRARIQRQNIAGFVEGDRVRDYRIEPGDSILFPYDTELKVESEAPKTPLFQWLWHFRTELWERREPNGNHREIGKTWQEYSRFHPERYFGIGIGMAFVATHNHFAFDRGGKVFNRSAPVIKLPSTAAEDEYLALLGLLNSSVTCFWLKQVAHNKGSSVDDAGARQRTAPFEDFYEFTATQLEQLSLPAEHPLLLAKQMDALATRLTTLLPDSVVKTGVPTAALLTQCRQEFDATRAHMIALQEELDWQCYRLYSLLDDASAEFSDPPKLALGQRGFEIALARKIAAGEEESTWFARHGSAPVTQIPKHWPPAYQAVVQKRIDLIESNPKIALIERPEYKRRWNTEPWEGQQERALRTWLLDRLESYFDLDGRMNERKEVTARGDLHTTRLTTVNKLADLARADKDFMQVAELFTARMDFDVAALVNELVAAESVPALPILRYKPTALDKRRAWERTWELQREEDQLNAQIDELTRQWKEAEKNNQPTAAIQSRVDNLKSKLPQIPVPPKYTSADFLNSDFWRLRGKLDVPKERWVSFPHAEGEDGTLTIAWAGYDHLQLARAIAERYEHAKETEGRKLVQLLAAIGQLIPWLKQWHNEIDHQYGTRMGDYFENYLAEEAKALGQSVEQIMAWTPPAKVKKTGRAKGLAILPSGAGGFPDNNRDLLLVAAGLALVGPHGISEEMHLDSMILMTNSERCRAVTANPSAFDAAIKGIDDDFWNDSIAKWKRVRDLLRQAKAIEIDPHSGLITRNEPVFSTLRERYSKTLDDLAQVASEAARAIQIATGTIQRQQQKARKREQEAA